MGGALLALLRSFLKAFCMPQSMPHCATASCASNTAAACRQRIARRGVSHSMTTYGPPLWGVRS